MLLIHILRWLSDRFFIAAEKQADHALFFCDKAKENLTSNNYEVYRVLMRFSMFYMEILYKCGLFCNTLLRWISRQFTD